MNVLFKKKLQENPFVYHYTSLEALFAILEGYRCNVNSEYIPFRASCIFNVNDPREMELGFSAVKKFLPYFEEKSINNMFLSDVYNSPLHENKCLERCNLRPQNGLIERGMIPYAISFSCSGDFLPMWSMYGNNKKGVCLKFNTGKLIEGLYGSCQVDFVSYDGEDDNYIMNEHFSLLYDYDAEKLGDKKMSIDEKVELLSIYCQCISPFIKSSSWGYEKEFRIVYNQMYRPEITEEYLRKIIFPFAKREMEIINRYSIIQLSVKSLESVIVGPLADYKSIEHVIRNELCECQLARVEVNPSFIQIR